MCFFSVEYPGSHLVVGGIGQRAYYGKGTYLIGKR